MVNTSPIYFLARKQADGNYCVFNVDVFGVGAPTAALDQDQVEQRTGNINRAWLQAAVTRHVKLRAENGYVPPVHVWHNDDSTNTNRDKVGFATELRLGDGGAPVAKFSYPEKDGVREVLIARANDPNRLYTTIRDIEPKVFQMILDRKLPYRSVEILDINVPDISSLALMFSTPPFFALRPLCVYLDESKIEPAFHFQPAMAATHFAAPKGALVTFKPETKMSLLDTVRKLRASGKCPTENSLKFAIKLVYESKDEEIDQDQIQAALAAADLLDNYGKEAESMDAVEAPSTQTPADAVDPVTGPSTQAEEVKLTADEDADDVDSSEKFGSWGVEQGSDGWYLTEAGVQRKGPYGTDAEAKGALDEMKQMKAAAEPEVGETPAHEATETPAEEAAEHMEAEDEAPAAEVPPATEATDEVIESQPTVAPPEAAAPAEAETSEAVTPPAEVKMESEDTNSADKIAAMIQQVLAPLVADMREMLGVKDAETAPDEIDEEAPIAQLRAGKTKSKMEARVKELEEKLQREDRINKFKAKITRAINESQGQLRIDVDAVAEFAADLPVKEVSTVGDRGQIIKEKLDMGDKHVDQLLFQAGADLPPPPISKRDDLRLMDADLEPYVSNAEALRAAQLAAHEWDTDPMLQKTVKSRAKYVASEVFVKTRFNADASGNGRARAVRV